jgi:hypothetical protein
MHSNKIKVRMHHMRSQRLQIRPEDYRFWLESGATDMGTPARVHGIVSPGLYSGQGPCRLLPKIGPKH